MASIPDLSSAAGVPAGGISSTVFVGTSQKLVNLMMVNIYDMLKNKTLYTHTSISPKTPTNHYIYI